MVEVAPGDRVGREVYLEAPVEQETVLLVRADAAADTVGRLEDDDLGPSLVQHFRAGEAGQSGPDDYHSHDQESLTLLQPGGCERSHTPSPCSRTYDDAGKDGTVSL